MAFDYKVTKPADNDFISDFPAEERLVRTDMRDSDDVDHFAEGAGLPNPAFLYRNTGGANHWLQIKLIGTAANVDAIGARIVMTPSQGREQMREINGGRGFFAQDMPTQHFGLKGATQAMVTIEWPSGLFEVVLGVAADQRITVMEGQGQVLP